MANPGGMRNATRSSEALVAAGPAPGAGDLVPLERDHRRGVAPGLPGPVDVDVADDRAGGPDLRGDAVGRCAEAGRDLDLPHAERDGWGQASDRIARRVDRGGRGARAGGRPG